VSDLIRSLEHAGTVLDSIDAKIRVKIEEPEIDIQAELLDEEARDPLLTVEDSRPSCDDDGTWVDNNNENSDVRGNVMAK